MLSQVNLMQSDSLDYTMHEQTWNLVLLSLKMQYDASVYASWFENLKCIGGTENSIKITAPTKFVRECVLVNYYTKIKSILASVDENIKIFDIRVVEDDLNILRSEKQDVVDEENTAYSFNYVLDKRFTFENFVTCPSNQFAYASAYAVANGDMHSALYIHGAVGLGKTHLLQSIAAYIQQNRDQKVVYLSAEKFMYNYVLSIRNNQIFTFKDKLRAVDVLIMDDIQFLCGKTGTQQEFSNTFNAFIEAGKSIILAADRSAYDLEMDVRTKSRISGGITAEIQAPDLLARSNILISKARNIGKSVSSQVLDFIAENITSSVRELEAALHRVLTYSEIMNLEVGVDTAIEALKDSIHAHTKQTTIDRILDVVAEYYNITKAEMLSKSRLVKFVLPRQVCALLCKKFTDKSFQEIGSKLGKRDHATVMYSVKKLEASMASNPELARDIDALCKKLQG